MRVTTAILCWGIIGVGTTLSAQIPTIDPDGIVHAAVFKVPGPLQLIAGGQIATIFGTNLAIGTQAGQPPLSTSLLGTSVTVGSRPVYLFFVSPSQINFEMPSRSFGGDEGLAVEVVVTTPSGVGKPGYLSSCSYSPGLFNISGTSCGHGAILNISASTGSIAPNSPSNSVSPGDYISIFGTGFRDSFRSDGIPVPSDKLFPLEFGALVIIDGIEAVASFNGMAPGLVGVNQFNVRIPEDAREGCAVPLQVSADFLAPFPSPVVFLSVHKGGGQCMDGAPASTGEVTLVLTSISGTDHDGTTASFDAAFPQSVTQKLVPDYPLEPYRSANQPVLQCPVPSFRNLSAGVVSLETPHKNTFIAPPVVNSLGTTYHQNLPLSEFTPGTYTVRSDGGGPTGPFQISIPVGSDVQFVTPPPVAGGALSLKGGNYFRWTGGDPDSKVIVKLISHDPVYDRNVLCSAPASAGGCGMATIKYFDQAYTNVATGPDGELILVVLPPKRSAFAAPGLTLGGVSTWRIEHHYRGFSLQPGV